MASNTILVVDDSITMRKVVVGTIQNLVSATVVEAQDGFEAIAKLRENKFDLILTDWNMPEMDGLGFLTAVRHSSSYSHIPIIMITSESVQDEVIKAVKNGVTDYIVKPFNPTQLAARIMKFLN